MNLHDAAQQMLDYIDLPSASQFAKYGKYLARGECIGVLARALKERGTVGWCGRYREPESCVTMGDCVTEWCSGCLIRRVEDQRKQLESLTKERDDLHKRTLGVGCDQEGRCNRCGCRVLVKPEDPAEENVWSTDVCEELRQLKEQMATAREALLPRKAQRG